MAYSKTTWKDRDVQYPNRFTRTDNGDGTITLIPSQGSIIEAGTPVNAANMNNIENGILTVNDATFFKTVGGTANAITTNINVDLIDGFPINIIIKYPNNGVSTTLNGIPILRPIGLTTPVFVANQLVTLVYSESNLCFFYKAIAEGNAEPTMVLEGETFSNFNRTGLVGTMKNNGVINTHISTPGSYVDLNKGFYGSGSVVTAPTVNEVFGLATVNNSNQIQQGYTAYGGNGTLYNGTYTPFNVMMGNVSANIITKTSSEGKIYHVLSCTINNVSSPPKLIFIFYDGFGKNKPMIDYPDWITDLMISTLHDPNKYFIGNFGYDSSIIGVDYESIMSPDDEYGIRNYRGINRHPTYDYSNNTLTVTLTTTAISGVIFSYILFL